MGTSLETSDDTKSTRGITEFNDMYHNIVCYLRGIFREGSGINVDSVSNYNCVDNPFRVQKQKTRIRYLWISSMSTSKQIHVRWDESRIVFSIKWRNNQATNFQVYC